MRNINLIPFNFTMNSAGKGVVDIHIDGTIVDAQTQAIYREWYGDDSTVSFKSFRDDITNSGANIFNIYINSGGGHLIDAMAIHDLLIDMQAKGKEVNTFGRGLVGSAATYILMAGNSPEMSENSWFMIHNVSGGISGTVDEIEGYAKSLRKFNDRARDFYAQRTGKRPEDITRLMNAETWFTASDAKANNFIKRVSNVTPVSNKISNEVWQSFGFTNTNVLQAYNSFTGPVPAAAGEDPEIVNLIEKTVMKKSFLTGILNALKGVTPEATATPEEIKNSIVAALQPLFDAVPDDVEPVPVDHTEAIANAVKSATDPFEIRLKAQETANVALKAKNEALIKQIESLAGTSSASNTSGAAEEKAVGSFTKRQ